MGLRWEPIIAEAAAIAGTYTTSVTLRQLHYRLMAANVGGYNSSRYCYSRLSELTAEGRRSGTFPPLADRTRSVDRPLHYKDPADARAWAAKLYRRDRTEGQQFQIWVLYEKATLSAQIQTWTRPYGIPTVALRGYSSESLEREIFAAMRKDGRDAVVFYIGDLDPSGEDIDRNFLAQADRLGVEIKQWTRIAVLPTQIDSLGLVRIPIITDPDKPESGQNVRFRAKYGSLFQVEVEAIDPADLRQLVVDAVTDPAVFDHEKWAESKAQEERDRAELRGDAST